METYLLALGILDSGTRLAVPLLCACLAGLYSEKAGVVDIGLEGKLLGAAFASATTALATGSALLGLMAGIAVSLMLSLVHGFACITQRGNQIVTGVAINILVAGLTALLGHAWFQQGGRTPSLEGAARLNEIQLPFAATLLPGLDMSIQSRWLGFRPSLPDGIPVIDQVAGGRVIFAFGHGHLGLTQGPATAAAVLSLVEGTPAPFPLAPYRADR